jgi:hypothetical protein
MGIVLLHSILGEASAANGGIRSKHRIASFWDSNPHQSEKLDPDSHPSLNSGTVEAPMEPWKAVDARSGSVDAQCRGVKVCRPLVADSHHNGEDQDPDLHQNEKLDPHQSEKRDPESVAEWG